MDELTALRKLAACAAYVVDGEWPQYDPWPDRIDELCEALNAIGEMVEQAKP